MISSPRSSNRSLVTPKKRLQPEPLRGRSYSDFCWGAWNRALRMCYLRFLLELDAPHGVQNDRNGHIMAGERGLESAQTFSY